MMEQGLADCSGWMGAELQKREAYREEEPTLCKKQNRKG